jgi:hypothetical protein
MYYDKAFMILNSAPIPACFSRARDFAVPFSKRRVADDYPFEPTLRTENALT